MSDVTAADATTPTRPLHDRGRYETVARPASRASVAMRYVQVMKPRIIELLLVTTVPTMIVAAEGWPGTWLVVATVLGGTLTAGSANAINNYVDRDVDRLMARTAGRPTAADTVSPRGALVFGLVLGGVGFTWLALLVNLAAALLATFAIVFYVFVYTIGLKRRTTQAVVIGGIAGCMPILVGWAAVESASFADPRPWLLFAVLLWWQPPHFWALAMKYRDDYAAANLPMLPVVAGNAEATRQILYYSYLLLSVVLLYVVGARTGAVFTVGAVALTAGWLAFAHRLRRDQTVKRAMQLFHYSTSYLAIVFILAAVDAVMGS